MPSVKNWFGDITSNPAVVVEAASVDDIIAVLKDPTKYPSPVRAVGSNHSTSACGVADGGTLIQMSKMNAIVEIGSDGEIPVKVSRGEFTDDFLISRR